MGKVGDDGLRTVECLRGRLLAERVASKAAKEQADNMARRVPIIILNRNLFIFLFS